MDFARYETSRSFSHCDYRENSDASRSDNWVTQCSYPSSDEEKRPLPDNSSSSFARRPHDDPDSCVATSFSHLPVWSAYRTPSISFEHVIENDWPHFEEHAIHPEPSSQSQSPLHPAEGEPLVQQIYKQEHVLVDPVTQEDGGSEYPSSIEDLPVPLQKFYSRAGDITLEREKLHEIDFDHWQAVQDRAERRNFGKQVQPPEQEFLRAYHYQRQSLIRALLNARMDAKELLQVCLHQGYILQDIPDLDQGVELFDRSLRVEYQDRQPYSSSFFPLDELSSDEISSQTLVESWTREVYLYEHRNRIRKKLLAQRPYSQAALSSSRRALKLTRTFSELNDLLKATVEQGKSARLHKVNWIGEQPTRRYSSPALRNWIIGDLVVEPSERPASAA